jgi:hypothetical protein
MAQEAGTGDGGAWSSAGYLFSRLGSRGGVFLGGAWDFMLVVNIVLSLYVPIVWYFVYGVCFYLSEIRCMCCVCM